MLTWKRRDEGEYVANCGPTFYQVRRDEETAEWVAYWDDYTNQMELVSPATIHALNCSCMFTEPLPHPLVGPRPLEWMSVAMIIFRPRGQDVRLELLLAFPGGAFQIIVFERMDEDLSLV